MTTSLARNHAVRRLHPECVECEACIEGNRELLCTIGFQRAQGELDRRARRWFRLGLATSTPCQDAIKRGVLVNA